MEKDQKNLTKRICIVAEDLGAFSTIRMLNGIMNYCDGQNITAVIQDMRLFGKLSGDWIYNEDLFQSILLPTLSKTGTFNLDGVLYIGAFEHEVRNPLNFSDIPIVMLYSTPAYSTIPTYRLDDVGGGEKVIKYLVAHGHRRIGIIAGEYGNAHADNRLIGAKKALKAEGISFEPELLFYGRWSKEAGYNGMKNLVDKRVDAVFCMSDIIATGAYQCLFERKMIPGKDISVIGYDDHECSEFLTPELTTYQLPLWDLGYAAMARLMEMIQYPGKKHKGEENPRLPGKLLERDSVVKN